METEVVVEMVAEGKAVAMAEKTEVRTGVKMETLEDAEGVGKVEKKVVGKEANLVVEKAEVKKAEVVKVVAETVAVVEGLAVVATEVWMMEEYRVTAL